MQRGGRGTKTTLNIPPAREMPPGHHERRRQHLVAEYRLTITGPERRRRRRAALAVAFAAAAALAAAAYAGYLLSRPTQQLSVGCYQRAALDADTAVVGADGRAPEAACRSVWRSAFPRTALPQAFAECVLASGAVGVFPATAGDTCARLGLARARIDAAAQAAARRLAVLKDELVRAFGAACLGEGEARGRARTILDRHGFSGWRIEVGAGEGFSPARPCASLAFDEPKRTLILVPMPRE